MRLLVVEDDEALRDVLHRGLTEQGHVVDAVGTGPEGALHLETGDYDGAIVDWNLPGQDGPTIVRVARAAGIATPVLLLTSRDTTEDVIAGLDAGADDFLRKPFVFGELEARLRSITRREASLPTEILRVDALTFDVARRSTAWRDRPIALTARETAFLEYFLRRPGAVVTRAALEDSLWERDAHVESNVVDVYVRRIRAKLADAGVPPILETVRGSGYRLSGPA
ncbi:MAG: response regulator transcription factor [Candidatus Eremiobacteraeota bacterium]|nr:response regulator transcription factor [Candidatus Eremiobacteraeota bacterium]